MENSLQSVFVKEGKRYTKDELEKTFRLDSTLIKKLKAYGVLATVANNQIQENELEFHEDDAEIGDIEENDSNASNYLYVFKFVGIIYTPVVVLKCYPKYISSTENLNQKLKKVLKVINRVDAKNKDQKIKFQNSRGEDTFAKLPVMLSLLSDYYEFGLYTNSQEVLEINGLGEINWNRTINDTFALISNHRPFYPELVTKKRIDDELNFFKRLHASILTSCSQELKQSGLADLFDFLEVDLSDEDLDDLGDTSYILNQIEKELNVQFNTRKQTLLKTMHLFVSNAKGLFEAPEFSFIGTKSFHVVWEKITADILDNHLEKSLKDLPIELQGRYKTELENTSLKGLIEKPEWYLKNSKDPHKADKTLIPDLITIRKNEGKIQFLIFDAKYYNLKLDENGVSGQPELESITKQYLYQLAYKNFTDEHNIKSIQNFFLFPTEETGIIDNGYVRMGMFHPLGLEDIQVRLLPADTVYDYYLRGEKLEIQKVITPK